MDDTLLLLRYAEQGDQAAFTELVSRHVNLVYFAALRRMRGDAHRAEEIAQSVFTQLARKAAILKGHTALTGWLYTATQLAARGVVRAEVRRTTRERKAQAMDEILSHSGGDVNWDEVRPVIDDALQDLTTLDREAVLLRYFENRHYAEIGAALRVTENSARMRVDRALEKLRLALQRRGVSSTAAALAGALSVPASFAAPSGLVQQLSATAVAGAAAASSGATIAAAFTIMNTTKIVAMTTAAAAILAVGVAVNQHRELSSTRAELAAMNARQIRTQELVDNLEWRLAAANERAAALTSANAVSPRAAAPTAGSAVTEAPVLITRDMVEERLQRAKELADAGEKAGALREFLWCYDTGMRQVDGYFLVRYSSLLDSIATLGKTYPPALDALRIRRDAAKERLLASANDMAAGKDFGSINRVLGENQQTFALFDSLPEDDSRRQHLVDNNIDRLIEAQRYRELAKAMPYGDMPQVWEEMTLAARSPAMNESAQAAMQRNIIRFAAGQIETRAGAGELVNASDLIERVLIFDNSPETVATIKHHLARAGHPELFEVAGP